MPAQPGRTTLDVLLMHPSDNVMLAVTDLPAGHLVHIGAESLQLLRPITSGHKLALRAIAAGELIVKYGQPIGRSTAAIAPGEHVHVHNVESLRGRGDWSAGVLGRLVSPAGNEPPARHGFAPTNGASWELGSTFPGYRRRSGRAGVRNHVLVMASVQCAGGVVRRIARLAPGVVPVTHSYGCGQLGGDLAQTTRTLEGFAAHPNVAAVLLVGLGCESLDVAAMAERLLAAGITVQRIGIQEEGGTAAAAERGAALARDMLHDAARAERVPISVSELIVGLECGGSDSWSGVTANPALGAASDAIVRAGGTVILSETPEFIGAEHLLAARAPADVGKEIERAVAAWEDRARRMGLDMRGAQPTPGNIAGGLTTIEEKSLGAITKGGSSDVQEMIDYACRPSRRGLVLMDTAGNDAESVTGMVAGGAQIVAFTTGRGSPLGCPIAPVIKIASNTAMATHMADDIDIDAGAAISEQLTLEEVGRRIAVEMVAAAAGKETASERWGSGEFAIGFVGTRF